MVTGAVREPHIGSLLVMGIAASASLQAPGACELSAVMPPAILPPWES